MDALKKAMEALDSAKSCIQDFMGEEKQEPKEDVEKYHSESDDEVSEGKYSFDKPKEFKGAKKPFN